MLFRSVAVAVVLPRLPGEIGEGGLPKSMQGVVVEARDMPVGIVDVGAIAIRVIRVGRPMALGAGDRGKPVACVREH